MSDLLKDPAILRELIMDHYNYPRNHELTDDPTYLSRHMASSSCIDDITVQAKFDGDMIKDIRFDGVACTICTASTSIMTELLRDKTIEEANEIMTHYFNMMQEKEYDEDLLEEAIVMQNVHKQANRIKCATIGWNAMKEMIEEKSNG